MYHYTVKSSYYCRQSGAKTHEVGGEEGRAWTTIIHTILCRHAGVHWRVGVCTITPTHMIEFPINWQLVTIICHLNHMHIHVCLGYLSIRTNNHIRLCMRYTLHDAIKGYVHVLYSKCSLGVLTVHSIVWYFISNITTWEVFPAKATSSHPSLLAGK